MRAEARVLRVIALLLPFAGAATIAACSWDVGKIFDRPDPQVERARKELEASLSGGEADLPQARADLEEVLRTRCEGDAGKDLVIERPNASLDLGLTLFRISELIGVRFGEEETYADASGEEAESVMRARAHELDCAHLLLIKLANDPATPKDVALRAHYLLGNFEFLTRRYKEAIGEYDKVLVAHPARGIDPVGEVGAPEGDDAVARDAAWNRAIALKRLDDQNDAGADADGGDGDGNDGDGDGDAGNDADADGGDAADASDSSDVRDAGDDVDGGRDSGGPDGGGDSGNKGDAAGGDAENPSGDSGAREAGVDAGGDTQAPASPSNQNPPPPPPPMSSSGVDLRELDRFDKKAPLDLDLPSKLKERKKIPKGLDK